MNPVHAKTSILLAIEAMDAEHYHDIAILEERESRFVSEFRVSPHFLEYTAYLTILQGLAIFHGRLDQEDRLDLMDVRLLKDIEISDELFPKSSES